MWFATAAAIAETRSKEDRRPATDQRTTASIERPGCGEREADSFFRGKYAKAQFDEDDEQGQREREPLPGVTIMLDRIEFRGGLPVTDKTVRLARIHQQQARRDVFAVQTAQIIERRKLYRARPRQRRAMLDRKRAVEGKSVSVRLEPGGRRIIKK